MSVGVDAENGKNGQSSTSPSEKTRAYGIQVYMQKAHNITDYHVR